MKKHIKILGAAVLLVLLMLCVTACSNWDSPYDVLDKDGYRVSVRFDANGGQFAGSPYEVFVVDVFNPDDAKTNANGKKEIALIEPDNPVRKDTAFEVSRDGYDLVGWYRERSPRVNENGEPLDEYGELCSVSGREQGYVYSGKWDFAKDRLEIDPNADLTAAENALTLYAAWIPYTAFEFYDYSTGTMLGSYNGLNVTVPEWSEKTGKLEMGRFPTLEGKTFETAYLMVDGVMTPVTGEIKGTVDVEKGIALVSTVKIYTDWTDGVWFKIYTAKQFRENFQADGNYIICADLDFSKSGSKWSKDMATTAFSGTIQGNGYKFSNISYENSNRTLKCGGLFGSLTSEAVIENVIFENATYILNSSVPKEPGNSFGLLAGKVDDSATLTNITVGGEFVIGADCKFLNNEYDLGVLFGLGNNHGIDFSGITCKAADGASYTVEVDSQNGTVTLTEILK